jgi:hypothetical protein
MERIFTMSAEEVVYHVVCKNVDGAYLLDKRNDIIYTGTCKDDAWDIFNNCITNKQKGKAYVLFAETRGCRLLKILCGKDRIIS